MTSIVITRYKRHKAWTRSRTYYHELTDESSLIQELARDTERALAMLRLSDKIAQKVRDGLAHLKTIRLAGPEGFGIEIDLRNANEGIITADLTDLFLELGALAKERGRGVVFPAIAGQGLNLCD